MANTVTGEQTIRTVHGRESDPDDDRPPRAFSIASLIAIVVLTTLGYALGRPHERLLKLLVALYVGIPIHTLGFVLAGRMFGVRMIRIAFYYGGALLRTRFGETWFGVGWLPLGGSVKFEGMGDSVDWERPPPRSWYAVHPLARAAIAASGCACLLAFACAMIGPRNALAEAGEIPRQTIAALSGHSRELLRGFFEFVDRAGPREVIGVTAAKLAALNLLPLPIVNGGQIILEIVAWILRRPLPPRMLKYIQVASLFVLLAFYLYFLYTAPFSWRDATATLIAHDR